MAIVFTLLHRKQIRYKIYMKETIQEQKTLRKHIIRLGKNYCTVFYLTDIFAGKRSGRCQVAIWAEVHM